MGKILNDATWKYQSRTVTDDQSVMAWVKWNPRITTIEDGTTAVTASRMQVQADLINFDLNGVADTIVGTYTGNTGGDDQVVFADSATIQGLLDRVNGRSGATIVRYMAGLGDFRPGFTIGTGDGLAVALTNILLGRYSDGLEVFADSSALATANLFGAAIGTSRARAGRGQQVPDYFETGYTSTTAGVVTQVRESQRSREQYPFTTTFECRLTGVHFSAAYATNAKIVDVYNQDDELIYSETLGANNDLANAQRYNFENPVVTAVGPIFVEARGTGALTDGPLTIQGFVRQG